ncbi:MAG: DUF885 domain-containing protein, partial [Oxalobacteraceae bacterium]
MIKTKIALAALLACFALAPASAVAAKPAKSKAKSTKVVKKSTKAKKAVVGAAAIGATAAAASKSASASDSAAPAKASEGRLDRRMSTLSMQYLTALWRVDPEGGIYVGKFDQAANLTLPDPATRAKQLAFANEWLEKFGKLDPKQLSPRYRTDLVLLLNKLEKDRWALTTWREFEWNPSAYN